jgi:hypothetical protein
VNDWVCEFIRIIRENWKAEERASLSALLPGYYVKGTAPDDLVLLVDRDRLFLGVNLPQVAVPVRGVV